MKRHSTLGAANTERFLRRTLATLCGVMLAISALLSPAGAADTRQRLVIELGNGMQLEGSRKAEAIFVADPEVADVSASPGEAHFVYGKSVGTTKLIAVDATGEKLFEYELAVVHNLKELSRTLASRFGPGRVRLNSARGSIYVSGAVPDERMRQNILASLKGSVPDSALIDEIVVSQSRIVQLGVQVLEVKRDRLERFGINWSALTSAFSQSPSSTTGSTIGSTADASALISMLISNGIAAVTAESTLATVGDRQARFSVGDEIAIPTFSGDTAAGSGRYSIDFKFVGINMSFTPRMLAGGKVNLEIDSEVSNLQASARSIDGNSFPNLASRRFSTSVELTNRQSFVVAGLSRLDTSASLQKPRRIPGGELARRLIARDQIDISQRDLIVVVTPEFGEVEKPTIEQTITAPQSNLEYILSRKAASGKVRLFGSAGFLY